MSADDCRCPESHRHGTGGMGCICCYPRLGNPDDHDLGIARWRKNAETSNDPALLAGSLFGACDLIDRATRKVEHLAQALYEISEQDPIELALDPQWSQRVAAEALRTEPS